MLRFAVVNGQKCRPFKQGRGTCPTCGGAVIAKCGSIKAHHWAHESVDDCDPWSEHVGPWHLSWQDPVQDEFVEVTIAPHRADIRNSAGTVIELQHSSLSPEDIARREAFYGDMVWVFEATQRFAAMPSGDRVFFSLERTEHIKTCQKKVFLDCGPYIIEVESFTSVLDKFSGFGRLRDRGWFASEYFAECMKADWTPPPVNTDVKFADWWRGKQPWRLTEFPSRWRDAATGNEILLPQKTLYIPLTYKWRDHPGPVWSDVISDHREIANGWTVEELKEMQLLLNGTPMILNGQLRVMPARAEEINVSQTVGTVRRLLEKAQVHMDQGRIPILRPETSQGLVEKAKQREIEKYGGLLEPDSGSKEGIDRQRGLFD